MINKSIKDISHFYMFYCLPFTSRLICNETENDFLKIGYENHWKYIKNVEAGITDRQLNFYKRFGK